MKPKLRNTIIGLSILVVFLAFVAAKDFTLHNYNFIAENGNVTADWVKANIDGSNITYGTVLTARLNTSAPADGDTLAVSNADQIYDFVTGQGYLTSSPFGASIDDTEMTAEDFGEFTCTGDEDGCTLDSGSFDDEYIELGDAFVGDVTGTYGATTVVNTQGLTAENITNLVGSAICGDGEVAQNVTINNTGLFSDCVTESAGTNYWRDDGDYLTPDPTYGNSVNGSNVQVNGGHLFLRYDSTTQANVTIDASGNVDWW